MQANAIAVAWSMPAEQFRRPRAIARPLSVKIELVLDAEQRSEPRLTANSSTTPTNSGCSTGFMSNTNSRSPTVRITNAPKIEPMALPEPPNSDVPPITTAAIELSV